MRRRYSKSAGMHEFWKAAATVAFRGFVEAPKKAVIAVCLLGYLAVQVQQVSAADVDCNFRQVLLPGITYYIYNPGYPRQYSGPRSCRWQSRSEHRIRLSCGNVSLPWSYQCTGDNIGVNVGNGIIRRHCSNDWFIDESRGNELTVTFDAQSGNRGQFLCSLQAISQEDEKCRCGWKKPTRIVGGTETGVNEYPMMAGLVNFINRELYCGGTIISPTHILTAAHCLNRVNTTILGVVVGEHNVATGTDTNATMIYRVRNLIVHPLYTRGENNNYDIAIVEIVGIIRYTNAVGPACLPFIHAQDSFAGDYVTALGWGTIEFGGPKSDYLQQVTLNVISIPQCSGTDLTVTNNQMCTYTPGKDSCQFDSGGPCLWMNPSSKNLVHIAIISAGSGCASDNPGINQRVGAYMGWIIDNTLNNKYCIKE